MKKNIRLRINGEEKSITVKPNMTLLELLRDKLNLTGTKYGCGTGECGACTVFINGEPTSSCLTLAVTVEGKEVTTIEGMIRDNIFHLLQEKFIKNGAIQCGFCTPGQIMTAISLLKEKKHPSEDQIKEYMKGNLCRCTGYVKIVNAISEASKELEKTRT